MADNRGFLLLVGSFVAGNTHPTPRASLPAVAISHLPALSAAPPASEAPAVSESPALPSQTAPTERWRVAVANGSRRVVVMVTTDTSSWGWLVQPGEQSLLLDEAGARPGEVDILSPSDSPTPCALLGRVLFKEGSFTITIGTASGGGVTVRLTPDASVGGTARANYYPGCTG
jgi:hypothetical protein